MVVFGGAAALAALALGGFGISRVIRRWSSAQFAFRAVGLTHRQRAIVVGLDAAVAVGIGVVVAIALAVALSPLWPLGQLRDIAPDTGINVDVTIVVGAASGFALVLLAMSAVAAWRASSSSPRAGSGAAPRGSSIPPGGSVCRSPAYSAPTSRLTRGRTARRCRPA